MKKYYLFIILIGWIVRVNGQPICRITPLNVESGMQQDNVVDIRQDPSGMMWFATYNGLCSYDGYIFRSYKNSQEHPTALSHNRILSIVPTKNGDIWCLTYDRRAFLFAPNTQQFHDVLQPWEGTDRLPYRIREILSLPKGVTWLVCDNGRCYRVDDTRYKAPEGITIYESEHPLVRGGIVKDVFQDSEGNEWLLSDKGVSVYGDSHIDINDTIVYQHFKELNGRIYLATLRGRLVTYDLKERQTHVITLPKEVTKISQLTMVRNHLLAIATDGGVVLYNPEQKSLRTLSVQTPEQKSNDAYHIYEDRLGELWVFTPNPGIVHLNIDTGKKQHLQTSALEAEQRFAKRVGHIFEDNKGTLWMRPNYGNFCYYDRKANTLRYIPDPTDSGKSFNPILRDSYKDRQGNHWMWSARGMHKLSVYPDGYSMNYLDEGYEHRYFFKDNKERIWAASKKKNVRIYNEKGELQGFLTRQGTIVKEETEFDNIYTICRDREGDIWLGSRLNGLYRLTKADAEGNRYRVSHYRHEADNPHSLSNDAIFSIFCDHKGRLWVGTYGGGVNLIRKGSAGEVSFIHSDNLLKSYPIADCNNVRSLYETHDGTMLVGTTRGLVCFPSDFQRLEEIPFRRHLQRQGDATSLAGNDVMDFCQTDDGTLYILTRAGGINQVVSGSLLEDDVQFRCYDRTNGLGSEMVYSIIEDDKRQLWISSEYMLTRFDPQQETFENYALNDLGIKAYFSEGNSIRTNNGKLLFCTNQGVLEVHPSLLKKSTFTPPILFTNLLVNNRRVFISDKAIVTLASDERNLRVEFAALDYDHPGDIEYAYQLEGVDKEWNHSGKNRLASYQNLPPGDFTLKVKSTNSDGVWCDNVTSLSVHVTPTFWQTPWAWLVWILLFAGTVGLSVFILMYIYRLRHRASMEQQLADIKLRFFTDISHELRTPLTLIAGPVSEVLDQEPLSEEARHHLNTVQNNTEQMLNLVNQILDFRKIQNNKMKLFVKRTDLGALLGEIVEKFRFVAEEHRIRLSYRNDLRQPVWIDEGKVETMFTNLMSNALKYTYANKNIHVSLRPMNEGRISISVADEGVGIAPEKLESIFHRFETLASSHSSQPSSGIGLSLVKRLVELHHGNISVHSRLGEGSEFIITLPVERTVYEQDANAELEFADGTETLLTDTGPIDEEETTDERDTILIVEDNAELRSLLRSILRKQYRVLEATNGEEGLWLATKEIPDLIISDIMMPVMDGLEMIHRIKESSDINHVLIVLLSAKAALDDRITAIEQGVDDYITKPFSATYLKVRIASLFERRRQQQERIMRQLSAHNEEGKSCEPSQPDIAAHDELFVQELVSYIEEQMDNNELTVDDMAERMCLGRSVFNRKMKSIVGITPVLFLQEIRIKRAIQLLDTHNYSISQVTYMVGFSDPRYFNRCFKKYIGVTPSEYLKQAEGDKEEG